MCGNLLHTKHLTDEWKDAVDAYKQGLEFDPHNAQLKVRSQPRARWSQSQKGREKTVTVMCVFLLFLCKCLIAQDSF